MVSLAEFSLITGCLYDQVAAFHRRTYRGDISLVIETLADLSTYIKS